MKYNKYKYVYEIYYIKNNITYISLYISETYLRVSNVSPILSGQLGTDVPVNILLYITWKFQGFPTFFNVNAVILIIETITFRCIHFFLYIDSVIF